jgi:hypothetical protein
MTLVMNPELEERLRSAILRNSILHAMLPKDFSEPLTLDQIDNIELLALEIRANTARMLALLEETADAQ